VRTVCGITGDALSRLARIRLEPDASHVPNRDSMPAFVFSNKKREES